MGYLHFLKRRRARTAASAAERARLSDEDLKMDPELALAASREHFWSSVEQLAFLGVVVALAIEFAALKLAAPYKKQLEDAKDLKIAELRQIAPRILSVPTQNQMREKLTPLGPLVALIGTTQPLRHALDIDSLGSQIAGVLALAGWKATDGATWGSTDRPVGVWVSAREGDARAAAAVDIIVSELNASEIIAHKDPKPFAGPKPAPPVEPPPPSKATDPIDMARRRDIAAMNADFYSRSLRDWQLMPDIQVVIGTKR